MFRRWLIVAAIVWAALGVLAAFEGAEISAAIRQAQLQILACDRMPADPYVLKAACYQHRPERPSAIAGPITAGMTLVLLASVLIRFIHKGTWLK